MDKRLNLIRKERERELKEGLKFSNSLISNLFPGPGGLLVNPVVKTLFGWFGMERAREEGLAQLDYILKCSSLSKTEKDIEQVGEEKFKEYLRYNIVYRRSDKKNEKFPQLENLLKQGFKLRLKFYSKLLSVEGNSYEELLKNSHQKREALEFINKQFVVVDKALNLAEETPALLKIPFFIKKEALRVLREGFGFARSSFEERIEEIY